MNKETVLIGVLLLALAASGSVWYKNVYKGEGKTSLAQVELKQAPNQADAAQAQAAKPDEPIPAAGTPDPAKMPTPQASEPAQVGARHVLFQYKGSMRSRATRSKEEARKRAEQLRDLARSKDVDFASLAKFSDEPGAAQRGGDLGKFSKGQMVPAFSATAFALGVGQVSDVVETEFGYHIILRTE